MLRVGFAVATVLCVAGCPGDSTEITPSSSGGTDSAGTDTTAASVTITASASASDSQGSDSQTGGTTATPTSSASDSAGTGSTTGDTAGTDTTASTTVATSAGSSSTGGSVCVQLDTENNDLESTPQAAGDATCDLVGPTRGGTLDGNTDIDWFQFAEIWGVCDMDDVQIDLNVDVDLEVCLYPTCTSPNSPQQQCSGTSSDQTSPDGVPGCCGTGGARIDMECGDGDNSALVLISVSGAGAGECVDYLLEYDVVDVDVFG